MAPPQGFDWVTSAITLLSVAVPALSFLGYRRYGNQKIGNLVGSSFDRRTSYNRSATEAESLLLSSAQVTAEQNKELAKRLDELFKQTLRMAEEGGKAKGKLEAFEEERDASRAEAGFDDFTGGVVPIDMDEILGSDGGDAEAKTSKRRAVSRSNRSDQKQPTKPRSSNPSRKKTAQKTVTKNVKPKTERISKAEKTQIAPSPKRGSVMKERMAQIDAMSRMLDDAGDEIPREMRALERKLFTDVKRKK